MTNLPNAPLIYTIASVGFPPVPDMNAFEPLFHTLIRDTYPLRNEVAIGQMQFDLSPEGMKLSQTVTTVWQFSEPRKGTAVVLSPTSISLHTAEYRDNRSFIESFRKVLTQLTSISGIGIAWTGASAIRYVDLVLPQGDIPLDQLLKPSVLPPHFTDVAELVAGDSLHIASYRSPQADVRFQVLRNPAAVLPVDLASPLIALNGWMRDRPSMEFAVVDTECSRRFPDATPMDVPQVCAHMHELRRVAKSIFEEIGTEIGKQIWAEAKT